jgi:hypothetical protein
LNNALAALANKVDDLMSLIEPIVSLIRRLKEGRYRLRDI